MEIVVRDKMARLSYPRCRRFMLTRLFVAVLSLILLLLIILLSERRGLSQTLQPATRRSDRNRVSSET